MKNSTATLFTCTHCDAQFTKWTGRCFECGKWGTVEEISTKKHTAQQAVQNMPVAVTQKLSAVQTNTVVRLKTNIDELDRVFGGGIVPGSLTLLGGEPGIGKSTLSLQLSAFSPNTLYVSGEESAGQVKLRADRLDIKYQTADTAIANETIVESICATIEKERPPLVIIDSIQTIMSADAQGEPGNVTQVRACTTKLLASAKQTNTAIIIIGHVTKEGAVAGPRTLEHLVDVVLYLEGDRHHDLRLLRGVKNRFGSTDEVGVFEMRESGLSPVKHASAAFIQERGESMSGSILTCLLEGTRPMLIEIQALISKTAFGYPVRKASGFDLNRLHVLIAVLGRRAGLALDQYDVHLNVVGGIKAHEPAADLAVALAIVSAYKDKAPGNDLVCFGEVGLGGEIRSVRQTDKRIKECINLGMNKIIVPKSKTLQRIDGANIIGVKNIADLIRQT